MTSRLAIVPARGGSKRVPDKNVRNFCGRPMIAHILGAARKSGLFDAIHVSTDSARIAGIVGDLGFPPEFVRPPELADEFTPLMPVLRFVNETFAKSGRHFDQIWLLMACAPLIEEADLSGAAELFTEAGSLRPVMSVAAYPAPIEWAFRLESGYRLSPVQPGSFAARSQDLAPAYYDTGAFCVFPERRVRESVAHGDDSDFLGYEIARHKAIDIDSEEDFRFAELLYATLHSTQREF
jgi:pseudaminic acid cytidylyltransferase